MRSLLLLPMMACRPAGPPPPALGEWALSGEQAQGFLRLGQGDCQIGLWTPRLSTGGEDGVSCSLEQSERGVSVVFPLRSGAGDATAAARWTDSGLELPLAARPGEVLLQLSRQDLAPDEDQRLAWSEQAALALSQARDAWRDGRFRLMDGERLAGELRFVADESTRIWLYDPLWWTEGEQLAAGQEEGPDLLLSFAVFPSMRGEQGLLRVQRLTGRAVVPLGPLPTPGDRVFVLEPGGVSPEERERLSVAAQIEAVQREQASLTLLLPRLAQEAALAQPPCVWPVSEEWPLVLVGYSVRLAVEGESCVVDASPSPVQHRRRVSARAGPEGLRDSVVHGL